MFDLDKVADKEKVSDELLERAFSYRIKSTDEIKSSEYVMKIDGIKKFSKQNISGWIGRAKSKKSFALTMFVAELLGAIGLYDKFQALKKCKVLYVDTEQSPDDVQLVTKRLKYLAGEDNGLFMYGLKPCTPEERILLIDLYLNTHKVDVLIVDGIRDLIYDINDAKECTNVMTRLMKWSYDFDLHVGAILHVNKGNGMARGHIGTELENKCQTLIRITKDENDYSISKFEEEFGRGKGIADFDFTIDNSKVDFGIPVVVDSVVNTVNVDDPF